MKVTIWGVRGSIPTWGPQTSKYGGSSSCYELSLSDGTMIVFDAGTGIRLLGKKLMREKKPLNFYLLLSHGHMDHVHGFPFFAPAYVNTNNITLAGCPRGGKQITDFLKRQMGDIYFPVEYDGLPATINQLDYCNHIEYNIGKSKVYTHELNHPGDGIGYKVVEKGKSFVYMTDNELMSEANNAIPFASFVEFVKNVDVLLHDTQYTPREYKSFTKGWGHSTYMDSARLAVEAGVKKLVLIHHDPDHSDAKIDWMVKKTQETIIKMGGFTKCVGGREGMTINI